MKRIVQGGHGDLYWAYLANHLSQRISLSFFNKSIPHALIGPLTKAEITALKKRK